MSRYKEHRGPKRRGYDDDYAPDYHAADRQPEYFSPRPTLTQGSEPVVGRALRRLVGADCARAWQAVVHFGERRLGPLQSPQRRSAHPWTLWPRRPPR